MLQAHRIITNLINQLENETKSQDNNDNDINVDLNQFWKKYASINNYSKAVHESFIKWGHTGKNNKWCVTEKVHGANFAIMYNGNKFGAAKRTETLKVGAKFFPGWINVVDKEKAKIIDAFKLICNNENYKNVIAITVYGELFGGIYCHNDEQYTKPESKDIRFVQKHIYYSPNLHFFAFDIRIVVLNDENVELENKGDKENKENTEIKHEKYKCIRLPFGESLNIFKQCGFLYCEPIMIGTFEECIKFNVETFETQIPNKLGLPLARDKKTGNLIKNIAEGIVIRKLNGYQHCMVKIKSSKYYEVTKGFKPNSEEAKKNKAKQMKAMKRKNNKVNSKNEKTKQSTKGKIGKQETKLTIKNQALDNKIDETMLLFIESCVNENRFESVFSKIGHLTMIQLLPEAVVAAV